MSESEQVSQLSALFDNELPAEQVDLVIRRVSREPALKAAWGRYALIGACIRSEPLQAASLAARVQASLAAETALGDAGLDFGATAAPSRGMSWFMRGAAGGAIAAAVAAVSILVMRLSADPADIRPMTAANVADTTAPYSVAAVVQPPIEAARSSSSTTPQVARESTPPSYTTPVDNSPVGQRAEAPLVNYVVAHSELAPSAVRFSPLSTVVYGNYDLTQDTVEMTEAEIGAHR
jgi:negative regulator of sigma E activity